MPHDTWIRCWCRPKEPIAAEEGQAIFLRHIQSKSPNQRWVASPGKMLVYDVDKYPNGIDFSK